MSTFEDKDYSSNDGMLTYIWGPPLWHSLHTMSFNYPVSPSREQKAHYFLFFKSLENVLPCKYCRDNLKENFKILPLNTKVLANRYSFSKWLYDLHNLVSKNLGKSISLSYEQVRDRYENFRSRCVVDIKDTVKKENGCVIPLYGKKAKCILNIVPDDKKISSSIIIDQSTILKKAT